MGPVRLTQPRILALVGCLGIALSTACSGKAAQPPAAIEVDQRHALADQPVHIRVTGLPKSATVTVAASAVSSTAQT